VSFSHPIDRELPVIKIAVRDYLTSVLPELPDLPMNGIAELTPAAWAIRK
jgi:hypothetical protein